MPPPPLPTIDISPFLPPHPSSPSPSSPSQSQLTTAHALHAACTHHGFFYLTSHHIPSSLTTHVLSVARAFFLTNPASQKSLIARRNPPEGDGARGYQVVGENVTQGRRDWHEGVDWYRPVSRLGKKEEEDGGRGDEEEDLRKGEGEGEGEGEGKARKEGPPYEWLQGPNLWPLSPPTFREVYEEYVQRMLELSTAVVRAMGVALDLEDPDFFVGQTRRSFWVMRAIGYPPLPPSPSSSSARPSSTSPTADTANADADADMDGHNDGISCGAHTDYGCLTLLLADPTPGALQVQTKSGDWIDADPMPGAFVVNIGDMMERWTNGLWTSTRHRVVHRGEGYRVSVPFFFEPDFEARVEPLSECVLACGGERRFGGIRYGEHLLGKVRGNFVGGG